MTTRSQNLRSSTPGQVPPAGTRQPGEIWMTFPDIQLGYIDASRNAQKLLAVRFFSALANYVVGDFVIQAGKLYFAKGAVPASAFNAGQWTQIAALTDLATYLPLVGGTLTGALVLAADPGAPLGAATKQYVDGKFAVAGNGVFLPLTGGTLTGLVTLSGPPSAPLHAATKAYVDAGAFVPLAGGTMTGDLILNRDAQVALGAATKQQVPVASSTTPVMNGVAAVGVGATWARADHVHATDTSCAAASALANYLPLTGGSITGTLGVSSTVTMGSFKTPGATLGGYSNTQNINYAATQGLIAENNAGPCLSLNRSQVGAGLALVNFFQNNSANVGSISVSNQNTTAYNTTSDVRLKTDAQSFDAGPILDATTIYNFEWTNAPGVRAYGVMAQEAVEVFPDAVSHDEANDHWGVDYSKYVPLLLNEIKALRARVAQLEGGAR